jgi:tetratricopeptide (TPR) repeat protein
MLTVAAPAMARTEARADARTPLNSYARARIAASDGAFEQASAGYAAALAAAPDNEVIAAEALAHGAAAGDWPLALRAAELLERREALMPDARFLLLAHAFRERDWRAAARQLDAIERDQLFAFATPPLRAWLAFGSRRGDPLAPLLKPGATGVSASYASEHRPLLLAAMGREDEARAMIEADPATGLRAARLRIAVAATLANDGDRRDALALLQGNEVPIAAARALVEARRDVPGAIDDASAGMAEVLCRMALDMYAQDLTSVAATFARLATWLAPDNSQAWMLSAELLARQDRDETAVALLSHIHADDPYAVAARDQRVRLLVQGGKGERALGLAQAAARSDDASVSDLVRVGEVLMDQDRPADAADLFAQAIESHGEDDGGYPLWALWLFRGSAHHEADEWSEALAALREAHRLAPDEALVLNYLGYAQLERRENLAEAEAMVRKAHQIAPDNAAITDSLGWALFLKGELGEAITLLERAAQGEPADTEINEHLGDAYFSAGRRIEARFAWRAARVYAEGEDAERLDAKIERGLTPQLAAR